MVLSNTYPTYITGVKVRQAIEQLATETVPGFLMGDELVCDQVEEAEPLDLYLLAHELLAGMR